MPPEGPSNSSLPLPDGWDLVERVADRVNADGVSLLRCGLAARSGEEQALGAAAHWSEDPSERAWYELLERIVVRERQQLPSAALPIRSRLGRDLGRVDVGTLFPASAEPTRWRFALSNGVALHSRWETACAKAEDELVERDRVLRAWLGETMPVGVPMDLTATPLAGTRAFEWRAAHFPSPSTGDESRAVVGLFGFPRDPKAPLVMGYGVDPTVSGALLLAITEAIQSLAFLWGEAVPESLPNESPDSFAHLERFQLPAMHKLLHRWLDGAHRRHFRDPLPVPAAVTQWADLTPAWMPRGLVVAKAISSALLPLTFGRAPTFRNLPVALQIHPIP